MKKNIWLGIWEQQWDTYKWKWQNSDIMEKMSTAPGIPRRSPIQVLTGPDVAWLQWSDENWYFQRGMAVDIWGSQVCAF